MQSIKKAVQYGAVCFFAFLSALNYTVFVFPNSFAPAGIDGICTMIQDVSKISMGYLSFFINIPLLISAYFSLSRDYAIKTTLYVISFSSGIIFLKHLDISFLCYKTVTGTSIVLAPVAAGAIRGILYAFTLKINASSGGVDIIAAILKKTKPYFNLMNIIFFLNLFIAVSSYFVYGFKIEPVICSIIYSFVTSSISNHIRSSEKETVKFEIITDEANLLCEQISSKLLLPATIVQAKGSYSGENKKMVICVISKKSVPYLEKLIAEFNNTVVFKSIVNNSLADI